MESLVGDHVSNEMREDRTNTHTASQSCGLFSFWESQKRGVDDDAEFGLHLLLVLGLSLESNRLPATDHF